MDIWVDADACPGAIREILYRAAERSKTKLTLVSNQYLNPPPSQYISAIQVPAGFDVADNEISKRVRANDIVITNDIPLAAEVIEADAAVIGFRGQRYTKDNIKSRLNMRDFLDTMRASGVNTGGPPAMSQTDRQQFANALDKILTRMAKLENK